MVTPGEGTSEVPPRGDSRFATVLGAAIAASGGTLAHLARRLGELGTPVSVATLSYWRSGRRRPGGPGSARALGNLERVLGLAPGDLAGTAVAGADANPVSGPLALAPDDPALIVRRRLDAPDDDGLSDDSVQHVLDVDAERCPRTVRVRCLHRATRDGVDRRVLLVTKQHPDGARRPFTALAGGRIGRTAEDVEEGVYAAEFLFDAPLQAGDTVVLEYQVDLGESDETFYEVAVRRRLRHAMVWVRFDPARLPQRVELYRDVRDGDRVVRPVDLAGASSVHHAVNGGSSTRIGVRWFWQPEPDGPADDGQRPGDARGRDAPDR